MDDFGHALPWMRRRQPSRVAAKEGKRRSRISLTMIPRLSGHLLVTVCILAGSSVLLAQTPVALHGTNMSMHPTPAATASVRFWKTDLKSAPNLRLTMTPVGGKQAAGHEIGSGGPGYQFANYQQVPSGRCTLEVFEAPTSMPGKSPAQPLAGIPADFSAGAFFTVLVTEGTAPDNKPKVEVIEDTQSGEKPAAEPAQISVRNFVSGLKDAHVSIGDVLSAQFASGAGLLMMRGVQPAVYQVRTSGTGPQRKSVRVEHRGGPQTISPADRAHLPRPLRTHPPSPERGRRSAFRRGDQRPSAIASQRVP